MQELISNLVDFLKVLADFTRLEILEYLKHGEKMANEIQIALNKSQSTISQQLKTLTGADLISVRKVGARKFYKIRDPRIFTILAAISSFLSQRHREKIDELSALDVIDTLY
ncbi:MAG: ArsR/SmtB family transcription factor [Candidatus Helarchaeota archaeon]